MPRLELPTSQDQTSESQKLLMSVQARFGFVPNLHRLNAIALAVSEVNACSYCLSAYCYVASRLQHVPSEEVRLNRTGQSEDAKVAAAAKFAAKVVDSRGHVSDAQVAAVRAAGFTDAQVLEIIAISVQFTLTSLINNVAGTDIDFGTIMTPLGNDGLPPRSE